MHDLFSDEIRRNPYPLYAKLRAASPVFREPASGLWGVFDYDGVKKVLSDHESFSSRAGPDWIIFTDPPRHTKLRALVSKAFTPRSIAALEPGIAEISRQLLDRIVDRGEMDLAADFAVPLPMRVIGRMLGIADSDQARFIRWNDIILNMSYTVPKDPSSAQIMSEFRAATVQMGQYLAELLARRRVEPTDDLLTRLDNAEVDGQRLTELEILGFFQGLLLAGSETTTNLINNAILCFIENPAELDRVRADPGLLPSAIEEVLRYRSPLQWMFRIVRRDVPIHGTIVPTGSMILAVIGAANRDPKHFADPDRFGIGRDPNPHIAFGHGNHFCLGAPLARLEARIALSQLLERTTDIRLASDEPWEPRKGLHVHGPTRLPIRFEKWNK